MTATKTQRDTWSPYSHSSPESAEATPSAKVFEDTLLESYIRAEQYDKAEDLLRERLNRRSSVRDSYWLARTKANTGDTETAQNTLKQVAQQWKTADPTSPEIATLKTLVNDG